MRTSPASARLAVALLLCSAFVPGCSRAVGVAPGPGGSVSAGARTAPRPPRAGSFATGAYRNLFREWNPALSDADVQRKLDTYWRSMFGEGENTRVYYPVAANANGAMAYILDTGNGDVRSEGMSYGMMIAVQMNRRAEFDALWNWARSHMQYQSGPRAGYFRWQCTQTGCPRDAVPASDGEEYLATALFFAAHRWGNGSGIYDYEREANRILDTMLHKEDMNGGIVAGPNGATNMFNRAQRQVVFVPVGDAATYTDPSYHLPAFYELWGRWAAGWNAQRDADRRFWLDAAARSRQLFAQATHPATGLAPDYSEFDGRPKHTGGHGDFRFDAFRTAVNWSVDYAWWAADSNQIVLTDRLQSFFASRGMTTYANQYTVAGEPLSAERSGGLIASNGAASLAATHSRAWAFVEALWTLEPPSGRYRYYDGLLQFMAVLHAGGEFRIHRPR